MAVASPDRLWEPVWEGSMAVVRSLVGWAAVVALSLAASGCPSGGGGGGGGKNHAPDAIDDTATTGEDTPVTIDVTANDTDEDDDVLLVGSFTDAANGTVYIGNDGSIVYEPDPNFAGTDTFTYVVTDGPDSDEVPATVTVTVNAAGDIPVASADSYSATEDTLLTVNAAAGILGNDSDVDSSFTAVLDQTAADGTLALAADGSFTYQPDADFDGVDTFTYHATDGTDDSSIVTVTIAVAGVNDAPVADADGAYTIAEDGVLTVAAGTGVLNGDTDVDGDALSAQVSAGPSNGSVALNADGSFTYTPNANFNGADSFTYVARDGVATSAPATVSLTITAVNDAPVSVADSFAGTEDTTLAPAPAVGVLANDGDIDSGSITAALVSGPSSASSFTLNADGSFSYTPNANFNGADSFTYLANDGTADGNIVTVSLTIGAANDAPVAAADSYPGNEDTVLTVNAASGVLNGDTDIDGNPLNALLVTGPTKGTLALNADGSFTYTPNANTNGADSFTYVARDGVASSAPATVSLTITAVNDAPVGVLDQYVVLEDQTLNQAASGGVLSNDTDVETASAVLDAELVLGPANAASFTLNANGSFVYTPVANYFGFDNFTYRVFDGFLRSSNVTVFITIANVNDAPVADDDSYSVDEDGVLTVSAGPGVLNGDSDADGQPLHAQVAATTVNGVLQLNADGSFTYTPNANYAGPDSFTYTARDGVSTDTATVTLTVNAVNDAPFAGNDAYTVAEDGSLSISVPGVLANDSDVESPITASLVSGPASASSFTLNANGSFTYTPSANFNGADSFTYRANDGTGQNGNIGTVAITVTSVNDAPTFAPGGNVAVSEDSGTVTIPGWVTAISAGPSNESSQTVGFQVSAGDASFFSSQPAVDAAGQLTFTLAADKFGGTSISVIAQDSAGASSAPSLAQITVSGVNDPPSFDLTSALITVDEDSGPYSEPGFVTNASAGPGEDEPLYLAFVNVDSTTGGLSFSQPPNISVNGDLTFTPQGNSSGSAQVTIRIFDPWYPFYDPGSYADRTFTIVVNPVNDTPSFVDSGDVNTVATSGAVSIPGWASNIAGIEGLEVATFTVTYEDPSDGAFFEVDPAIDSNGTLTFDPLGIGDAEMKVVLSDGGLTSVDHFFTISVADPSAPPSLVSSTPSNGDLLSQTEAYAPGNQLAPMRVVFDDPGLDCGALSGNVTVTLLPATPISVTLDCSLTPGTVALHFPPITSAQMGDAIQVDIANIQDTESPPNAAPFPVTILFTLDTQAPSVSFLDDVSPFGCRALNTRLIAQFNESMDSNTSATFLSTNGPPTPVIEEPVAGRGFAGLDAPDDTFFLVPRDLLANGSYEVDASGMTDIAGNPASTGPQSFQVCGNGGGPGPGGGLEIDRLEIADGPTIHDTIDDSDISNGFTVAAAIVEGTDDDVDLVFGMSLAPGFFAELQMRSDTGGDVNVSGTVSGNTVHFDLASLPGFTWNTSDEYRVNYTGCAVGGTPCSGRDIRIAVADDGDSIAPEVSGVAGRRASSVTASVPLYRPEEPIRVGFSEAMDRRTFVASNFLLEDSLGTPVPVVLVNEDRSGLGAEHVTLRADRGDGMPGALAAGTYTLSVSGLLDLGEPQNALALSTQTLEVSALDSSFQATPQYFINAVSEMDPQAGRIFVLFDDAMSRSSFVDTGDPSVAAHGFRLDEYLTGTYSTAVIPLKGMSAAPSFNGSGNDNEASEPEIVALSLASCCGPSPALNGFRAGNDYGITLYQDLRNADGNPLSGAYASPTIGMSDDGDEVRPTFTDWRPEVQIFPAGALLFDGSPLESNARFQVRFEDNDVFDNGNDEEVGLLIDVFQYGTSTSDSRTFGPSQTLEFDADFSTADVNALFAPGDFHQVSYYLEDDAGYSNIALDILYVPFATPAAPVASFSGDTLTITGTIADAFDASFVDSVEVGVAIIDESGSLPDIQDLAFSAIAHVSRDAAGAITYEYAADVLLPDITPLTYRAFAVANLPSVIGTGSGGVNVFSLPGASFAGNGTPLPPPEPFFSEYVEGASTRKAIEIYNPANVAKNLTGCAVNLYSNGSPTVTGAINLTATIPAGDVFVICGTSPGPVLGPRCDLTTGSLNFNGNDAVELSCNSTTLDVIGQIGNDPGVQWGTGLVSTSGNTLARACGITSGDSNGADAFNPALEWDGFPIDTLGNIGYSGCVVQMGGIVREDNAPIPGGGDGLPEAGALVEVVDNGVVAFSTVTDANGLWSLDVPDDHLFYLRFTDANIPFGTQRLVTTADGLSMSDILITQNTAQFVYDFASGTPGSVNPNASFGTVFLEPNSAGSPVVSLGTLLANGGSGPTPFGPNSVAFLNVDPGLSTVDISSPSCSLDTESAQIPLPAPLQVNAAVVTFLSPVCGP